MEELSEAKTSRGRVSLRTVLRARTIFGFYSYVSARAAVRVLTRLYCLFMAYFISTMLLTTISNVKILMILFVPKIIELNVSILISLLTGEYHFYDVCKVIEQVDREMGYDELILITPAAQYTFLLLCASKSIYLTLYLFISLHKIDRIFVLTSFIKVALSLNPMINIILLDLVRHRLILLRRGLKCILNGPNLSTTYIKSKIKAIHDSLNIYKTLVDSFNPNTSFLWGKLQTFTGLVGAFVSFICHGYQFIWKVKTQTISFDMIMLTIVEILGDTLVACSSAIFTELVIREVDKFKKVIGIDIIDKDNELYSQLVLAGEYLELRPFEISIFRVFNIDGSLVITFAGLCTTYLIFLLQTTGLI